MTVTFFSLIKHRINSSKLRYRCRTVKSIL